MRSGFGAYGLLGVMVQGWGGVMILTGMGAVPRIAIPMAVRGDRFTLGSGVMVVACILSSAVVIDARIALKP